MGTRATVWMKRATWSWVEKGLMGERGSREGLLFAGRERARALGSAGDSRSRRLKATVMPEPGASKKASKVLAQERVARAENCRLANTSMGQGIRAPRQETVSWKDP